MSVITKCKQSPKWCGSCAPTPTMALVEAKRCNQIPRRVYPTDCKPPCCPPPSNTRVYDQPIKTYRESSCCGTSYCGCTKPQLIKTLTQADICPKVSCRYKRSATYRTLHTKTT